MLFDFFKKKIADYRKEKEERKKALLRAKKLEKALKITKDMEIIMQHDDFFKSYNGEVEER